jgi:peptidoglycan/LPS O-acetylase OafA/YrhL
LITKTNNKAFFPALTGMRAIAAYMVYIVHTDPFKVAVFGQQVFDFFNEFHIGVTIFFVLSGFLITYRYFDEKKLNFRQYFINRFARIYPMYFLLTTALFIYFAFTKNQFSVSDFWIYLANITFFRGFFDSIKHSGLGQGWTLSVEEVFYLLAPLLFLFIKRSKYWLFSLPFVIVLLGFGLVEIFKNIDFFGFMNANQFMLEFTFFGRCFEFFTGIALALFIKKQKNIPKTNYVTYFGIFGICISTYLLSIQIGKNICSTDTVFGKIIIAILLPVFGVAPLFYGLIKEKTLISRILQTKLFLLLGKSSYIFYLIHIGVFAAFVFKNVHNYILVFLIINLVSVFLYQFVEKPLNIFIKDFFKQNSSIQ